MSNTARFRNIFRSTSSRALDRIEDPRHALDDSYNQQLAMLQQVRRALADVATAKKRVELQGHEMGARYANLADQAEEALVQGRDDLARIALERRSLLERQVVTLRDQHASVEQQQQQLQAKERQLASSVEAFRTEKETIKALYTASSAQVRANEAVAGIGTARDDIGANLQRAKDRVAQMQARAAATDSLLSTGALLDLTAAPDADLQRQLAAGASAAEVERQLRAMKSGEPRPSGARGGDPDSWLGITDSRRP